MYMKGKYQHKKHQGFQKGHHRIPWNKGKKGVQKVSEVTRKKFSLALIGNQYAKGSIRTKKHREAVSLAQSGFRNWNWKGGIAKDKRTGSRYYQWRSNVFQRD